MKAIIHIQRTLDEISILPVNCKVPTGYHTAAEIVCMCGTIVAYVLAPDGWMWGDNAWASTCENCNKELINEHSNNY